MKNKIFSWEAMSAIWIGSFITPLIYSFHKYKWKIGNETVLWESFKSALWWFIPVSILIFGVMQLLIWVVRTLNDK